MVKYQKILTLKIAVPKDKEFIGREYRKVMKNWKEVQNGILSTFKPLFS